MYRLLCLVNDSVSAHTQVQMDVPIDSDDAKKSIERIAAHMLEGLVVEEGSVVEFALLKEIQFETPRFFVHMYNDGLHKPFVHSALVGSQVH